MLAVEPTSTSDPDRLVQDLGGAAGTSLLEVLG